MPKAEQSGGGKVAVLGAGGQLGRELTRYLGPRAIAVTRADLELGDEGKAERILSALHPWAVVNAAAFNQVDLAETRRERALTANARGPAMLAALARRHGWRLLHFSTDYVFGGDCLQRPRLESDPPSPVNFYGYSKLLGEEAVLAGHPSALVVRVAHLYGGRAPHGRASLVDRFLERARRGEPIQVTQGQTLTPTSVRVLAPAVLSLLENGDSGLFHLTGDGECSARELARAVLEITGLKGGGVELVAADPRPAPRAPYTVLENRRWAESGRAPIPDWRAALAEYLRETAAQFH